MNEQQTERLQELARQRWNRMVKRDEKDLARSVLDAATAETRAAARRGPGDR